MLQMERPTQMAKPAQMQAGQETALAASSKASLESTWEISGFETSKPLRQERRRRSMVVRVKVPEQLRPQMELLPQLQAERQLEPRQTLRLTQVMYASLAQQNKGYAFD
jgi:hypothetical protein